MNRARRAAFEQRELTLAGPWSYDSAPAVRSDSPPDHGRHLPLLDACVSQRASDIHLSVGRKPVLRVHGSLIEIDGPV
jgi:hypothetical protein